MSEIKLIMYRCYLVEMHKNAIDYLDNRNHYFGLGCDSVDKEILEECYRLRFLTDKCIEEVKEYYDQANTIVTAHLFAQKTPADEMARLLGTHHFKTYKRYTLENSETAQQEEAECKEK